MKGEWETGLAHLAKGSDADLKALASESATAATEPAALVELADRWWAAAEKAKGKDKADLRVGAAHYYNAALPNLTGLTRTKVEKLLALVPAQSIRPSRAAPIPPTAPSSQPATQPQAKPADHPPLDARLAQYIRSAIGQNRTIDTPRSGAGGTVIRHVPEDGVLLVALAVHWQDEDRTTAVGVTPIYQTVHGQKNGPRIGRNGVKAGLNLAKPGYAIGGVELPKDSVVEGMRIVMMRVNDRRLDPQDNYSMTTYGRDPNVDRPRKLGLDGSLVVGITGTTGANGELTGFGLVLVR